MHILLVSGQAHIRYSVTGSISLLRWALNDISVIVTLCRVFILNAQSILKKRSHGTKIYDVKLSRYEILCVRLTT